MIRAASALGSAASIEGNLAAPIGSDEGETLGFRTIFAYWPQYDLLITGSVNSRPPNGEDRFGPAVIGAAFTSLTASPPPPCLRERNDVVRLHSRSAPTHA